VWVVTPVLVVRSVAVRAPVVRRVAPASAGRAAPVVRVVRVLMVRRVSRRRGRRGLPVVLVVRVVRAVMREPVVFGVMAARVVPVVLVGVVAMRR